MSILKRVFIRVTNIAVLFLPVGSFNDNRGDFMKYVITAIMMLAAPAMGAPDWAETAWKCKKRSIQRTYRMGFGEFSCVTGFRNNQDQSCILKRNWCVDF